MDIPQRHQEKLEGQPLTNAECNLLLLNINGKSVCDSAKMLRDEYISSDRFKIRYDVTIFINVLPRSFSKNQRKGSIWICTLEINGMVNQKQLMRGFKQLLKTSQPVMCRYPFTRHYIRRPHRYSENH